jgi:hypothetical protein
LFLYRLEFQPVEHHFSSGQRFSELFETINLRPDCQIFSGFFLDFVEGFRSAQASRNTLETRDNQATMVRRFVYIRTAQNIKIS